MHLSIHDYLSEAGTTRWLEEIGCSKAPVTRANVKTALAFFAREMPGLPVAHAVGFIVAMDLSKSVTEVTLKAGERILGFREPDESPFKLFFAPRGASPYASGINAEDRKAVHFVVRTPVRALHSFTTGAKVTWSRIKPGSTVGVSLRAMKLFGENSAFGVMASGGGPQYIIPRSYSSLLVEEPRSVGK